ncbi:MAG: 50S ribosomal protein L10 [Bacteroidetes bacterium 4572_114]|nr:MAG: 50S ribosomal protein L10 [Bacteroidetes bacterium 4572_114]
MTKTEKNQIIETLVKDLNENPNFYLTDIGGLTVESTGELRRLCFKKKVKLKVTKNTLLRKAMEKSEKELNELYDTLRGPNSIMFTEAGNAPARLIKEFRKKFKSEKPLLKGAYVEESAYIGEDQLDILENIKSKNEVIADIIALLQSPTKNVISALQSGGHKISGILETLSERPA